MKRTKVTQCKHCEGLILLDGQANTNADFWCECTGEEAVDEFKKRHPEGLKTVGLTFPENVKTVSVVEDKSKLSVQILRKIGAPNEIKELWGWMKKAERLEQDLMFQKADGHAKQTMLESQEKYINELEKDLVFFSEITAIYYLIPPELMKKILEIKKRQL